MEIVFLGTGASIPSTQRSLPSVALRRGTDITLLDCGEGTQRQLMFSPLSFMKVERILLSHLHGDHVLGIPGLLQTMSLSGRERPLRIMGPPGTGKAMRDMMGLCHGELSFKYEVTELGPGEEVGVKGMDIKAVRAEHGPDNPESLSYVLREHPRPGRFDREKALSLGVPEGPLFSRLQNGEEVTVGGRRINPLDVCGPVREGRSVAYSGDTLPNTGFRDAARGVDVMIHEATFADAQSALANDHGHSTSSQAAEVARDAGAGVLFLTHFSSRYKDASPLLEEAKRIFPDTCLATDLSSYRIPLR